MAKETSESGPHCVLRFELLESGIRLGIPEIFCQLADFYPDGITFDAEGNLLVTLCGGGTLVVVSPTGQIVGSITTEGKGWTNCVFGGDDFQALYLIEDDLQALLSTRWPIPGQRRYSLALVERIAEQSIHGTPLIFVCILTYDIYYWLSGFCFAMEVIAEILNATLKLCYILISI